MQPNVTNILDALAADKGKAVVQKWIASFSCPVNPNIEAFLKDSAVDFAAQRVSITYLVTDAENDRLFFTGASRHFVTDFCPR